ncbi:MAG: TetR/AcrR family transcriptional regulator [Smithellaceae bacterium]|jgi:AcrR family transcriptional regulator|nr:TetR/AcrR family transcriptional regulator [Smithellaceae bacterium]MDD3258856.1 TetR/AcrR family transcriptional regulator [Smithellaceae bacterium]MDD3848145.1 TetR/AcrR family transcriptional regulator [Smithellaceae bacterium]HPL10066.1 TetR/AcrR family transcriptional regulator [Smithellaceae bacterium]
MADHVRAKTRKNRIMDAALRIFAEKSFQEATISEISKEAGVSEATIYEYFGTKEDLLFAIPEKISNDTYEESEAVLPFIKDVEGRMRAIMLSYIQLYESNPHYSALVLLQLMSNKRFRQTAAHAAIRRSAHRLLECIREGIANGTFRPDADAYLIRSILMGTIEHLFIHWHMLGMPRREKTIMEMLDPFLEIVLNGIRAKKDQQGLTLHLNMEDARSLLQTLQNDPALQSKAEGADASGKIRENN